MTIERDFAIAYGKHGEELEDLVTTANNALKEAKELAEATGIPFKSELGVYIPNSIDRNLDPSFIEAITEISEYDFGNADGGWRSSSIKC